MKRNTVQSDNSRHLSSQAGVTLIELMVAMGISSLLLVASMSLHLETLKAFQTNEDYSSLNMDSHLLNDYFRTELMKAGGGSIRGWMGIHVENNCLARGPLPGCNGSDRLNTVSIRIPEQECLITAHTPANVITANFRAPGDCCLQPATGLSGAIPFEGQQVVISLNGSFIHHYISSVNATSCRAVLSPGQLSFTDFPNGTTDYTGGIVTIVKANTFYWKSSDQTLNLYSESNGDNNIQNNESQIVAAQIYDFQVALGYDFKPADGKILETADGSKDEWLYNSTITAEQINADDFIDPPWSRDKLVFASLGIAIGANTPSFNGGDLPRFFDGPTRNYPGVQTRRSILRVAPRNTMFFQ